MPVTVKTKKRKEKKKNIINLYTAKVRHAVLCQEVPFFFIDILFTMRHSK